MGKYLYKTKKDAQTARNKRMREGVKYLRIYYDENTGGWHLTKYDPVRKRKIK